MADVVFDNNFFKKLANLLSQISDFIKERWFLGVLFVGVLIGAVLVQQIILILLQMFK